MKTKLAVAAFILIAGLAVLSESAFGVFSPPASNPGKWAVENMGEQTIASHISSAKTYRISPGHGESVVTVEGMNSDGLTTNIVEIQKGKSMDVGVPAGGSLKVRDTNPADPAGASGSYETV